MCLISTRNRVRLPGPLPLSMTVGRDGLADLSGLTNRVAWFDSRTAYHSSFSPEREHSGRDGLVDLLRLIDTVARFDSGATNQNTRCAAVVKTVNTRARDARSLVDCRFDSCRPHHSLDSNRPIGVKGR